ncbi:hypothetical protein HK096_004392, partial [Nowakowskiella sp. JEL0078]
MIIIVVDFSFLVSLHLRIVLFTKKPGVAVEKAPEVIRLLLRLLAVIPGITKNMLGDKIMAALTAIMDIVVS